MITIEAYFADPATGVDRRVTYASEYQGIYLDNATELLSSVNNLLQSLGIMSATVSSGWRPISINNSTPHAATHSYHMVGKAVDIHDTSGALWQMCAAVPGELRNLGLWLEDRSATPTWTHIDNGNRADRDSRVFKP